MKCTIHKGVPILSEAFPIESEIPKSAIFTSASFVKRILADLTSLDVSK